MNLQVKDSAFVVMGFQYLNFSFKLSIIYLYLKNWSIILSTCSKWLTIYLVILSWFAVIFSMSLENLALRFFEKVNLSSSYCSYSAIIIAENTEEPFMNGLWVHVILIIMYVVEFGRDFSNKWLEMLYLLIRIIL